MASKYSLAYEAQFDHVHIPLEDGYETSGFYYDVPKAKHAVLLLHGIQSHAGWFTRTASMLQQNNIIVLSPDRRGSGLNQVERGHAKNNTEMISDIDCWVQWLKAKSGIEQVDIVAISISGKSALPYVHLHPQHVRTLALVSPGLCPKIDIRLNHKIAIGAKGPKMPFEMHALPSYGADYLTSNHDMIAFIQSDPLILTEVTAGYLVALRQLELKIRRAIKSIELPVGLFLAGCDQITDNGQTIDLLASVTGNNVFCYKNAQHTLDFDPAVSKYLQDLISFLS